MTDEQRLEELMRLERDQVALACLRQWAGPALTQIQMEARDQVSRAVFPASYPVVVKADQYVEPAPNAINYHGTPATPLDIARTAAMRKAGR